VKATHLGITASWLACATQLSAAIDVRDEPAQLVLRNRRLTLTLSKAKKGAIVSLVDRPTGLELVDRDSASDLIQLICTRPGDSTGKQIWLSSVSASTVKYAVRAKGRSQLVAIVFDQIGGRNVSAKCTVTISPDTDELLWGVSVQGSESLILEEIHFPRLELRAPLSGDGGNDAVVAGLTKGGVFRRPTQWKVGKGIWSPQPGSLCAQFGCYYSPEAGLCSATHDRRGYPKTIEIQRTKQGLRWAWRHRGYHDLTQPFELGYEVALTTFSARTPGEPTDWRDAADLYKAWALKQPWCATTYAERRDVPAWLKAGPSMVRFSRSWLGTPERVEAWLNDYWRKHFPAAPLIVAFWGWERVGSWVSPKYFPPYPSEEGFARCVRAAKRVGGHGFPWPSGYYWNVSYRKKDDGSFEWEDRADFDRVGKPHALIKRDGTPLIRKLPWLGGGENAVLCRGDAWTRQWLNNTAGEIVKRGCDMVQVDQVVGGAAPGGGNCFSVEHGHPRGVGAWDADAFADQLRTMLTECRRIDPNAVLSIEEPQELFNHLIAVQDYRDYQKQRWPRLPGFERASIFSYLYHEFLPVFQSNPRRGDRLGMAYCLVNGQIPHWVPHWPLEPSPMLRNGTFETWDQSVPAGWSRVEGWQGRDFRGVAHRDERVKRLGESSMRLENTADDEIVQISQNVQIGPAGLRVGATYRLRTWLRVDELARPNRIGLAALTPDLKSKGGWGISFARSQGWSEGHAQFTVPAGASFLRIMIHVHGRCRLWVDDAVIEEALPDGRWRPLMHSGLPGEHDLARQWVELFHGEGRPYLLLGRMLHPPKLLLPTAVSDSHKPFPPILLSAYRAPNGSDAAVAVNVTDEAQDVRFRWRGKTWELRMDTWEARLVKCNP